MRISFHVSLAAALIATTLSATARERAFRAAELHAVQPEAVSIQCAFKVQQMSGFRAAAGARKICYFDCDGRQAAITIPGDQYCAGDRVLLVREAAGKRSSPVGRSRLVLKASAAAP